jgi:hypothetical protein
VNTSSHSQGAQFEFSFIKNGKKSRPGFLDLFFSPKNLHITTSSISVIKRAKKPSVLSQKK